MADEYVPARDDQEPEDGEPQAGETTRALVVRPTPEPMLPAVRSWASHLPTLIGERLPALWDGGNGPLARAAMAGGLLVLGSVVGRMAANPPGALVPVRTPPPVAPAGETSPRRREIWIETEVGEMTGRERGSATVRWQRHRVRIVEG